MANINDIIDRKKEKELDFTPEVIKPEESPEAIRDKEVKTQLEQLFKIKPRITPPTPEIFQELAYQYFEEILPENYAKYTFHTFIGMSEANIKRHILPVEELKQIYEFVIEKLKAKSEIMMQVNGRATDSFNMQNIAGWRKKDPEEAEKESGLADLHKSTREYKKKKEQQK